MSGMYCGGHGDPLPCKACAANLARRVERDVVVVAERAPHTAQSFVKAALAAEREQWTGPTAQHTPGPWPVERRRSSITAIGPCVATEYAGAAWLDVSEEDARLIAAAPELLEACQAQHHAIDVLMARLIALDPEFRPTKSEVWPALVTGNAAIAKATGSAS